MFIEIVLDSRGLLLDFLWPGRYHYSVVELESSCNYEIYLIEGSNPSYFTKEVVGSFPLKI